MSSSDDQHFHIAARGEALGSNNARHRTAELQQHRTSGLALVTAAVALWNTVCAR